GFLFPGGFFISRHTPPTRDASAVAVIGIVSTLLYRMSELVRAEKIKTLHNAKVSAVFARIRCFPILIDKSSNPLVHVNAEFAFLEVCSRNVTCITRDLR